MKPFWIALASVVFLSCFGVIGFSYWIYTATPQYDDQIRLIVGKSIDDMQGVGAITSFTDELKMNTMALIFVIAEKKVQTLRPPPSRVIAHYGIIRLMDKCRLAFGNWSAFSPDLEECLDGYIALKAKQ